MTIQRFTGEYEFLSNFSLYGVFGCDTVEHWYQAMKTLDTNERNRIRLAATPGEAKRLGRGVRLRPDWEIVKVRVMRVAIQEKFAPGSDAAEQLDLTGNERLIEGNYWHDNFWGVCTCENCEDQFGHNMLGKILMRQRTLLRRI